MLEKINSAVNESKNDIPKNMTSERRNIDFIDYKSKFVFIIIGDVDVGKTSFFKGYFEKLILSIGIDLRIKYIKVENDVYHITLYNFPKYYINPRLILKSCLYISFI